jgi:hypothetical protein
MQIKPRKQSECKIGAFLAEEILADRPIDITKYKVINGQHAAGQQQGPKKACTGTSIPTVQLSLNEGFKQIPMSS